MNRIYPLFLVAALLGLTAWRSAASADSTPELVLQFGHDRGVSAVALSPDGATLVSGGDDATVKFWDTQTGELIASRSPRGGMVYCVACSPDGRTFASGDDLGRVIFWDARTAEREQTLRLTQDRNQVFSVAWSPNGRLVAAGSVEGTVKIWDAATGALKKTWTTRLDGQAAKAFSVAWSPDGQTLATALGAGDEEVLRGQRRSHTGKPPAVRGNVSLWDVQTGRCKKILALATHEQDSVAFSPDGAWIAATDSDQTIREWDAHTGRPAHQWKTGQGLLQSVAFSPDGKTLASTAYAGSVKFWEPKTGRLKATLLNDQTGMGKGARAFTYSRDGRVAAIGLDTGDIDIRDANGGAVQRTLAGYRRPQVHSVAFSPDGHTLAGGLLRLEHNAPSGEALLWDLRTGALRQALTRPSASSLEDDVRSIAFSPDGSVLATGSEQDINLWAVPSGQWQRTLTLPEPTILVPQVMFSSDGTAVIAGSMEGKILRWDSKTGQLRQSFDTGKETVLTAFGLSPDGNTLATGSARHVGNTPQGELAVWDVETGHQKQVLSTVLAKEFLPEAFLGPILYSPDGKWLVCGRIGGNVPDRLHPFGSMDGMLEVRDALTGTLERTLKDNPMPAAFSPDSRTLVTGSGTLWDVPTGTVSRRLIGADTTADGKIAFSPDGRLIAAGNGEGMVKLWSARTGELLLTWLILPWGQAANSGEWLAVTPTGDYDGSPGAEAFLRWRVGARLYPASAYAAPHHRPDLIQHTLQGSD